MSNVATIEKIRSALRSLRNAVESKGEEGREYNLMMGVSFAPAKGLSADDLIKAVEGNRKISPYLVYGMQAGLRIDPKMGLTRDITLAAISEFEQQLAALPQDLGANMTLEFTVSNPHEKDIVEEAQKNINAIVPATGEELQKLKATGT